MSGPVDVQDTPRVGVALDLRPGTTDVPLETSGEHLLVVLIGTVVLDDAPVQPGRSAYLGPGRDQVLLTSPDGASVLLLGGEPFEERIVMWWDFVGRSREEVAQAGRQWSAALDRFGRVATDLPRLALPT